MLHSNQIQYFNPRLARCAEQARQASLFSPVIAYGFIGKQEAFFSDGLPADVYAVFAQQVLQLFEQFGIGVYLPAALQV